MNADNAVMHTCASRPSQIVEAVTNKSPTAHKACMSDTITSTCLRSNLSTTAPPMGEMKNDGRVNAT